MINTFSLILLVITGISGIFWIIKKLCIRKSNCSILNIKHSNQFTDILVHRKLKSFFTLILVYGINFIEFIASMFPILLLVFLIRSFLYEPFQIPSGSMMPTLLIGDLILVKKFVYGIKNPFNQQTLIHINSPKRGDVIVFKYPKNPKLDYIKRVIGEPGDRILYNLLTKQLKIYPNYVINNTNLVVKEPLSVVYNNVVSSDFIQMFNTSENGSVNVKFIQLDRHQQPCNGIRLIQTTESFNGLSHNILTMIPPGNLNFVKIYDQYVKHLESEWIVPLGEYFVMGDNRDNSSDSRYWGFVPERNIVGKAMMVWMSVKKSDRGYPIGIRFNRIGNVIQ